MNEEQLVIVNHIRNAVDDLYDKLEIDLYKKNIAAKTTYEKVNVTNLVNDNLEYIVKNLKQLKDGE